MSEFYAITQVMLKQININVPVLIVVQIHSIICRVSHNSLIQLLSHLQVQNYALCMSANLVKSLWIAENKKVVKFVTVVSVNPYEQLHLMFMELYMIIDWNL